MDIDLASRSLGGSVLAASDESFGEKENLLVSGAAAMPAGRYGHKGEIVDGWETRRRRSPGHDWVVVRLGAPGVITSVDVDTTSFTGNFPEQASVQGCTLDGYPSSEELTAPGVSWVDLVPRSALRGDASNVFPVRDSRRYTHVRLCIHPDGGVARLRVAGRVCPDPARFDGLTRDLAAAEHGGLVVAGSDDFYSTPSALLRPGLARHMGEGWETRRRRDGGNDWVVIQLAAAGRLREVEVDTSYYKYNASAGIALAGWHGDPRQPVPLLPHTRLQPDTRHHFPLPAAPAVTHVRVDVYPDGGLSRLRLRGELTPEGRAALAAAWQRA
jgi:allantoicase